MIPPHARPRQFAEKARADPSRPHPAPAKDSEALRLAAQCLNSRKNYFGDLYRRWKARLGTPKAITAMAHKLARILWHLFKYRQAFDPEVFRKAEEKMKRQKLARLHHTAAALGLRLVQNQ